MNKKLFIQIFFIFLTIAVSFLFFKKTFDKKKDVSQEKQILDKKSQSNLIEGIQYFSKDMKGNTYLIKSESGKLDEENPDIIYLANVKATIKFDKNEEIYVTSSEAIYNISNFDTEFIDNVKLIYEDDNLTCNNIIVKFSENYAILSDNLIYNNLLTSVFADKMEVDLISRTTKTSMYKKKDKIKIIHKK